MKWELKSAIAVLILQFSLWVTAYIAIKTENLPILIPALMTLMLIFVFELQLWKYRAGATFWSLVVGMLLIPIVIAWYAFIDRSLLLMLLTLITLLLTIESLRSTQPPLLSLKALFPDSRIRKLAKAAGKGDIRTIDRLVEQGVDVNGRGIRNITPLCWSVGIPCLGIAQFNELNGNSGINCLPYELYSNCKGFRKFNGNFKGFQRLLELGADPNTIEEGDYDYTVMYSILSKDNPDWLRLALEHGANPNLSFSHGWTNTPLHFVSVTDSKGKCRLLLDAAADINIRNKFGETPLIVAANDQEFDAVLQLLDLGADFRLEDYRGKSLLDEVIYQLDDPFNPAEPTEAQKVFDWLTDKGVEIPNRSSETEIRYSPNVLWMKLPELFSDPMVRDLGKAVRKGQVEEIDWLVAQGVDVNKKGFRNATVLALALVSIDAFKKLLELGADPNAQYDSSGRNTNIMYELIMDRHIDCEFLKLALEYGGDPNFIMGANKESLLFEAIRPLHDNRKDMAFALMDAGADLNFQAENGQTPMMLAAQINQYELVYAMLKRGADYSIRANDGKNLLDQIAYHRRSMAPTVEIGQWREKVIDWLNRIGVKIPESEKPVPEQASSATNNMRLGNN